MKLEKKRELAARTFKVGKQRIIFNTARLSEIKDAITKQDIKDLHNDRAISIKEKKGSKKIVKRKTRRRLGSIKKPKVNRKQEYVKITRKLRSHLAGLKRQDKLTPELFTDLRKQIRARNFRSLSQLKDHIASS